MENGMADSPEVVRVTGLNNSSPKVLLASVGVVIVGEGTSSDRREGGSFRDSEFQMALLQGKELPPPWFQLKDPVRPGLVVLETHGPCSLEGLAGLEGPEVKGPPGRECLRWADSGISFNHDVLRTGFVGGAMVLGAMWSPSSSDEANASESGVDRRTPG